MTKCRIPECSEFYASSIVLPCHLTIERIMKMKQYVLFLKENLCEYTYSENVLYYCFVVPLIPIKEKKCACGDSHVGLSTRPKLMLKVKVS